LDSAPVLAKAEQLGCRTAKIDFQRWFDTGGAGVPPRYNFRNIFQWLIDARDTGGNWWYALRNETTRTSLDLRPEFIFPQKFLDFRVGPKLSTSKTKERYGAPYLNFGGRKRNNHHNYDDDSNNNQADSNNINNSNDESGILRGAPPDPSEEELKLLFGRGVGKPSLEKTIRTLCDVRSRLRDEIADISTRHSLRSKETQQQQKRRQQQQQQQLRDEIAYLSARKDRSFQSLETSNRPDHSLESKEKQLSDVDFVLEELTRWQKNRSQYFDQITIR